MEAYTPAKTYSYTDLIRELLIFICAIALIYVVCYLWVPVRVSSSGWLLSVVFFVMNFYNKTSQDRLQQLTFDTVNKEIIISFKSMFSAVKQKKVSFEQARLEVVEAKSKLKLFEPINLYIMKEKMEVFEITRSKDGLSIDTLRAIVQTARQHGLPIIDK